jgi:3-oxoacyl-[acyl-carrier-protein] synthase-1
MTIYLSDLGIINALGEGKTAVLNRLLQEDQSGMLPTGRLLTGRESLVGTVREPLDALPAEFSDYDCRNNRLLVAAARQIEDPIRELRSEYGPQRIAVLVGTSTSGIGAGEEAMESHTSRGEMPADYHYRQQGIGTGAEFLAAYLQLDGPRYTISTACTSSAKVFASGERLLAADLCDAVIVGGSDSLCRLTVNGFDALSSLSNGICNPFSINRNGINVGEGAALFLLTRTAAPIRLAGVGESSDAYHMSAPDPSGNGAELAIRQAMANAGVTPELIGYINLHGTATRKNDEMESRVVNRIFGSETPCSSTKSQIGHTLGAAGAQEIGLCWLLLCEQNRNRRLPRHLWDGEADPELPAIALTSDDARWTSDLLMSNSFAFGGSNVSLIIGRAA